MGDHPHLHRMEHLSRGRRPNARGAAWAGAWTLGSGAVVVTTHSLMASTESSGAASWLGMLAGTLLMGFAVLLWLQPRHRYTVGMAVLGLALVVLTGRDSGSLVAALLAGIGGCLAIQPPSWPSSPPFGGGGRTARLMPRRRELAPIPVAVDTEAGRRRLR